MAERVIERSVGLVVMTEVPGVGLVAVLQERGRYNFEKMKPESFPGGCQVTVHGKLEEADGNFDSALLREARQELGPDFAGELDFSSDRMLVVGVLEEYEDEARTLLKKHVLTFATKLQPEVVRRIRLHSDSGGLHFVTRGELEKIADLRGFNKQIGVPDRATIAMFPDEKEAVEKAFARFS